MTVPSLTMKQTVSLATILAAITLASPAAASDTHGCWTNYEGTYMQVIATKNIPCRDAVPFMRGFITEGLLCSAGSTNSRCVTRYRRYTCVSRLVESRREALSISHCMRGPGRRIGLTFSLVDLFRNIGRG